MKNIRFLVILIASVGLFSCSEDIMQEINKNPNNPSDVASKFIITDIINNTSFTVTGTDFALYASIYVEYNVGIWNQMYNAEIRSVQPTSSTTYNNSWNSVYSNLLNLKIIINKCSEGGDEDGNVVVLGIAQILSAYNLAMLTDMMGDVPWTEALQPAVEWTPKLDSQESIYTVVNKFLDDGIANLAQTPTFAGIGAQDPIYNGSAASWTRFAYGLKARYAMRLSKVKPNYDAVLDAASKSFTAKSQETLFKCSATIRNPFQRFFTDRDYFGASQSLLDKLVDRQDPREGKFFRAYPGTSSLIFAPNGKPAQRQGYYGISAQATSTLAAPVYLLSFHELEFLRAEANARKGGAALETAKTHLKNAITVCFTNVGLTAENAADYYTKTVEPKLTNQTETLKEIMMQKYLGLFEVEAAETYNDIRRLKAMGEGAFIPLANTLRFPLRYTYGADDVTTNENVRNAYGDGSYVWTENVWWAGGSR